MKKLLTLLLAAIMMLSLASCSFSLEFGEGPAVEDPWAEYETITIAEALELCGENGNVTTERYYIRAFVDKVTNAEYGAMVISDETGSISVYGTYSEDGAIAYKDMESKPYKGDEVLLHCILQNYNGTKEVKNARLIDFVSHQEDFDSSEYKSATVSEAREADKGEKLSVSGVVARITYANGMKPNGFILVDNTSSIYVFDADAAQRVAIGNTVEIAGEKDYWILDSEVANAQKFGYEGSCQLTNANLISNDGKVSEFNKSWITESSVKDMIDTPVTENVTAKIFKVVCRVSKVPGNGFVNYYFNDLDYIDAENPGTGTYTYTQCNGSDFGWLDAFDGKMCTVYLTALNAKSTASDCFFRFLPISVETVNNFEFAAEDVPAHAVKYYGLGQFLESYAGDPALELLTSVSSSFLGFEGATLSYSSSNPAVITITEQSGKTVMNCLEDGTATVTVTATYGGKSASDTVTIKVKKPAAVTSVTVAEAIAAESGTVAVKGIVGPMLVNQCGFYLIDETGVIGVRVSEDTLAELKTGYEVVVSGNRTITKEGGGQICIDEATVVNNNYGSHDYSKAAFITDMTITQVSQITDSPAETVKVYIVTGKVTVTETAYYSQVHITDGTSKILLYSNSASQYSWLSAYAGQELTIELNTCDWNAKGLKGCVLAVTLEDGTRIVNSVGE